MTTTKAMWLLCGPGVQGLLNWDSFHLILLLPMAMNALFANISSGIIVEMVISANSSMWDPKHWTATNGSSSDQVYKFYQWGHCRKGKSCCFHHNYNGKCEFFPSQLAMILKHRQCAEQLKRLLDEDLLDSLEQGLLKWGFKDEDRHSMYMVWSSQFSYIEEYMFSYLTILGYKY